MFKHLGRFAVLAVCLFAIAIVMVGCDGDEDGPPPIVPPIVPPVVTQVEKLPGLYELVEVRFTVDGDTIIARPPIFRGTLGLHPYYGPGIDGNDKYSMSVLHESGSIFEVAGFWSADESHFSMDRDPIRYTWDGTYLTLSNIEFEEGGKGSIKWRQTDKWGD